MHWGRRGAVAVRVAGGGGAVGGIDRSTVRGLAGGSVTGLGRAVARFGRSITWLRRSVAGLRRTVGLHWGSVGLHRRPVTASSSSSPPGHVVHALHEAVAHVLHSLVQRPDDVVHAVVHHVVNGLHDVVHGVAAAAAEEEGVSVGGGGEEANCDQSHGHLEVESHPGSVKKTVGNNRFFSIF